MPHEVISTIDPDSRQLARLRLETNTGRVKNRLNMSKYVIIPAYKDRFCRASFQRVPKKTFWEGLEYLLRKTIIEKISSNGEEIGYDAAL